MQCARIGLNSLGTACTFAALTDVIRDTSWTELKTEQSRKSYENSLYVSFTHMRMCEPLNQTRYDCICRSVIQRILFVNKILKRRVSILSASVQRVPVVLFLRGFLLRRVFLVVAQTMFSTESSVNRLPRNLQICSFRTTLQTFILSL